MSFRVIRWWVLAAAAVPSWAQAPRAPSPPPETRDGTETIAGVSASRSSSNVFTTSFRGRELSYVVIDGMAVHAGDIVLGRVEDLERRPPLAELGKSTDKALLNRRGLSPIAQEYLWPEGVLPYVIDTDVSAEQRQNIEAAIRAWNDNTVISLVARTAEVNYVRFSNVAPGNCRSLPGMVGGEQEILLPPFGCPVNIVVHEIGHAVGLFHEHQRVDRDEYVTVLYENMDSRGLDQFPAEHPVLGPYDYASTMHYSPRNYAWNGGEVFETLPPGMDIPSEGLSAGDIDGVARLYGQPPEATSIATNPPGLEIVVDGVRVTAPVSFDWAEGGAHILEAPVSQIIDGTRYLFGRWNDGGSRLRNLTADPGSTWLEANFIVQHHVDTRVEPVDTGTVELRPSSPDGFYTLGTPIQAVATPDPGGGRRFWYWDGARRGYHGSSSNPAAWRVDWPGKEFAAVFTDRPLFRVEGNVDPFDLHIRNYFVGVDEGRATAPVNLVTDITGNEIGLRVEEVQRAPRANLRRYRFENWSDGGARSRTISLPPTASSVSASIVSEYPLSTGITKFDSGTVTVDPASADGYYRDGAAVRLAALPNPGWEFVQWRGDIEGREPSTTMAMNRPMHVEADLSQTTEVGPDAPASVTLAATNYRFDVYDEDSGFRVEPPSDASEVRISFEATTPDVEVDLLVRAGSEYLPWHYGDDGRTPEFGVDYRSALAGSSETVVINASSTPPLDPSETYYVGFVVFSPGTRIEGELSVEIDRAASLRPSTEVGPRALTFVSPPDADPASQVVRLTNKGASSFRYVIDLDRAWLSATPATGTLYGGSTAEIEVGTLSAGVWPDTHGGRITVTASAPNSQILETVAAIPVTFVVTPASTVDSPAAAPTVESIVNLAGRTPGAAPSANLILYGTDLALGAGAAESAAPPTVLQGASVTVTDSLGTKRLAGLWNVGPTAIVFLVPNQVSLGSASVITNLAGTASEPFSVEILAIAPGLYSANLDGTGIAWGYAIRVDADGESSFELITDFDAPVGSRTPIPVSLGPETDDVYLRLWGTGIRGWTRELRASVGDRDVEVHASFPDPQAPGNDIVDLGPLPRSLAGSGEVGIVLVADGRSSNSVTFSIQ